MWLQIKVWFRQKIKKEMMIHFSPVYQLVFVLFLGLTAFACFTEEDDQDNIPLEISCADFAYPDTLFFIKPGQSNIVNPIISFDGTYSVIPDGLAINTATGAIDVNASETGLKYKIAFSPTGSDQVCETFVTIGGVNYLDGVYVLNQNQSTASPIYNGVPGLALPCEDDDDDDDDDDSSCDFDAVNPSGQLLKDLGFEISNKGVIDLQKTVENGTFGSTPKNGTILNVELYYKLNDPSALALNKIPLRVFYYDKLSDVPQKVLDDIKEKRSLINESRSDKNSNFRLLETVRPAGKPRPPYVVIVASFE
jgi:hypothetical protein